MRLGAQEHGIMSIAHDGGFLRPEQALKPEVKLPPLSATPGIASPQLKSAPSWAVSAAGGAVGDDLRDPNGVVPAADNLHHATEGFRQETESCLKCGCEVKLFEVNCPNCHINLKVQRGME